MNALAAEAYASLTIMANDKEIARQVLDFQARARDYRLMNIPGYMEWSKRRLREGVSEELIAHLDASSMILLPEDLATIGEQVFEELLQELESEINDEA